MPKENQPAPEFELKDQDGEIRKLSDYLGQYILVYFYPKDDTPGCTKEACAIRDLYSEFEKNGIKVFGISADSELSHKKFKDKYRLPFILLSDPKKEIIKKYGANKPVGIKRISYLIGKDGNILKSYPKVTPAEHAKEIIKDFLALADRKL